MDVLDGQKYGSRDNQSRGRGYSSAGAYSSRDVPPIENYGNSGSSLVSLSSTLFPCPFAGSLSLSLFLRIFVCEHTYGCS